MDERSSKGLAVVLFALKAFLFTINAASNALILSLTSAFPSAKSSSHSPSSSVPLPKPAFNKAWRTSEDLLRMSDCAFSLAIRSAASRFICRTIARHVCFGCSGGIVCVPKRFATGPSTGFRTVADYFGAYWNRAASWVYALFRGFLPGMLRCCEFRV